MADVYEDADTYPVSAARMKAMQEASVRAGAGGIPVAPGVVPPLSQPSTSPAAGGLASLDMNAILKQMQQEAMARRSAQQSQMDLINQQASRLGQGGISDLDRASMLFQAAGALAAPTRTGSFMESLGAAGTAVSGPLAKAAQAERDRQDKIAQLQLVRAKLAGEMGTGDISSSDMLQLMKARAEMTQAPSEFERIMSRLSPEEQQKALRVKAGLEKAEGKADKIPFSAVKEFAEAGGALKNIDETRGGFKNEYADKTFSEIGNFQNWLGSRQKLGYGDQADWWSGYYRQMNVVRNALFGSTLTKGEEAAFNRADINPGMHPDQIRKNLDRQQEVARSAAYKLGAAMAQQGFDQDTIESALGYKLKDLSQTKKTTSDIGKADPLSAAREAIKKGAPKDAVIQRLKENGIDPSGL